jgi:hypothetical protein
MKNKLERLSDLLDVIADDGRKASSPSIDDMKNGTHSPSLRMHGDISSSAMVLCMQPLCAPPR